VDNIGLYVVITLAVIFVTPYLYMHISAMRAVGKSVPINDLLVENHADPDKNVYAYFMSKNCSMCKPMTPVIEKLKTDNSNIVIIDINQDPELAKEFHIYGTPTLMAIRDGFIKKVKLGKLSLKKLEQFIAD
jgi:thioredoxin 1